MGTRGEVDEEGHRPRTRPRQVEKKREKNIKVGKEMMGQRCLKKKGFLVLEAQLRT